MTPTQRLFTDEQGGEIVGFTAGQAVVRYGKRLRLESLEDILLLDPQDILDETLEEREAAWRRSWEQPDADLLPSNPLRQADRLVEW